MEQTERWIDIYQKAGVYSLAAAVLLLAAVVVLAVRFRIFHLFGECSGRSRKRAVEELRKKGRTAGVVLLLILGFGGQSLEAKATEEVKPPLLEAEWRDEKGRKLKTFYQTGAFLQVKILWEAEVLDKEKTYLSLTAKDAKGEEISCPETNAIHGKSWMELEEVFSKKEEVQRISFRLETEAIYTLEAEIWDPVADRAEKQVLGSYCLDRSAPEIKEGNLQQPEPGDFTFTAKEQTILEKWICERTFGYFCKPVVQVHIQAQDLVSGVSKITYEYEGVDADGKKILEKGTAETACFEIPGDFRGVVRAKAWDHAGNSMKVFAQSVPLWAETEDTHQTYAKAELISVEGEKGKEHFFRGDVVYRVRMEDAYSGIRKITFRAGTQQEVVTFENSKEQAITESEQRFVVEAEQNSNEIQTEIFFTDFAGHRTEVEGLPEIHVDTARPKVFVFWDNLDARNGNYYKNSRTASIEVQERNFVPEEVELELSGMAKPKLSWNHEAGSGCEGGEKVESLGHVDDCRWTAKLLFERDGRYTFGVSCKDAAGNAGTWGKTETFVIDRTAPKIQVFWTPAKGAAGGFFRQKRRAVVEVQEKHFTPKDGKIQVQASNRGTEIPAPVPGGFQSFGEDVWRAGISFETDGEYLLQASCEDMAGNEAVSYVSEKFVIDRTAPQITFLGVTEASANAGVAVPKLQIFDTNYAANLVEVTVERSKREGSLPPMRVSEGLYGSIRSWEDLPHVQENDDLYRFWVKVQDKAGNVSEESLHFSLNRFGSVYSLGTHTKEACERYYLQERPTIVLSEYNADELEEIEITSSREGEVTVLQEGTDYQLEKSGDERTWKCYTYEINADTFEKDGTYTVTVTSKDRAGNRSSNSLKGVPVIFTVDRSAPEVLVSGVEEGGRYRSPEQTVLVEIVDSFALEKAEVWMNGKMAGAYTWEHLKKSQGKLKFSVTESHDWQTLSVKVWDRAGNTAISKEIRFLVTESLWFQFWRNETAVLLTAGIGGTVFAAVSWILVRRKRKACIPETM